MFLFGHLGITLGIAFLLFHLVRIESNRRLYSFILIGALLCLCFRVDWHIHPGDTHVSLDLHPKILG